MKLRGRFLIFVVLAAACAFLLVPVRSYTATTDSYKPTPPPAIPAADFNSEGRWYLDFTGLYASIDTGDNTVTIKGIGAGVNYVGMVRELGWNVSLSCLYLTGEDDNGTADVTGVMTPFNANIAFRPISNPGGNSLILFAGLHYSFTGIWIDMPASTPEEIDVYLRAYGPMFGAKARLMLKPGVAFIPYYVFRYESYDADVVVDGVGQTVDVDSEGVQIIGFDIEIGAISIGAMIDSIANADRKVYFITFTYNLSYDGGSSSQKADMAAPKTPQRGRAAK